jgi:hypothetical protein
VIPFAKSVVDTTGNYLVELCNGKYTHASFDRKHAERMAEEINWTFEEHPVVKAASALVKSYDEPLPSPSSDVRFAALEALVKAVKETHQ